LNVLQRIVGIALAIVLFIAAFIFASVIFAAAAILALGVWGWLVWKTRDLRKAAAQAKAQAKAQAEGTVIEGEYRVERETRRIDDDVH
jgi:cobalamin biosynthesis protein CobD/CbiB